VRDGGRKLGVIITPEDVKEKKKIKKVAKELGMDPEELEKLLRKGKSIRLP